MTAPRDPDRLIHAFLMEGRTELADPVFDAVRATIERKRQRAVIGPWRLPNAMNKLVPIGLGAAAVVAVLVIATLGPAASGGVGGAPSPSATPTPTAEPSVAAPSASAASVASPVTAPPLTGSFTSTLHGFSLSFPEGWSTRAATQPWTDPTFPLDFRGNQTDFLFDPIRQGDLFLTVASQPIGDATPEAWLAEQMASGEGCGTPTKPVMVDSASGLTGGDACTVAVVTSAGRGYWIQLYTSGDDPTAVAPYDRAWFDSVLATIQLRPEDAIDVAASPSP